MCEQQGQTYVYIFLHKLNNENEGASVLIEAWREVQGNLIRGHMYDYTVGTVRLDEM